MYNRRSEMIAYATQPTLDLEQGCDEPDLCFSRSQVRDPAYALLDSGATHVLLPGHMLPKGARSFEVTANLLDTKFVWEDGTAVMQCRDKVNGAP